MKLTPAHIVMNQFLPMLVISLAQCLSYPVFRKGETIGIEADLRWLPADFLELYTNVGLLRARFDDFVTPLSDLSGRDQAHAPRYTMAVGGIYRHSSGVFARLDVSAKDAFYFDVNHDQKSDSYTLANARQVFPKPKRAQVGHHSRMNNFSNQPRAVQNILNRRMVC